MDMPAKPLIIDCDPGVDDAIALLVAFGSPELHLLGITTVAGNVPLVLTQSNARKICELAKRRDVPVFAGCPRPMLRSLHTAEEIHGTTGLQGAQLPDPALPLEPTHAVQFLIDTLIQATEPITIAALGPLTNLAIALIQAPTIANKIERLVIMGGAIAYGNVTPTAEFNIYVDPHAAQVVFSSGIPITLISLDITHQVLTTADRIETLQAVGTPVCTAAAGMLRYYGTFDAFRYGIPGSPLHDPCVVVYLLRPDLFRGEDLYVAIATDDPLTQGQTVIDRWRVLDKPPNAHVIQTVQANAVYQIILDRLMRLS
jgi:purine nucleosidase